MRSIFSAERRHLNVKTLIDNPSKAFVFALEFLIFIIVNIFDALEEFLVERNLIIEFGQQWGSLLFGFGDARSLWALVRPKKMLVTFSSSAPLSS